MQLNTSSLINGLRIGSLCVVLVTACGGEPSGDGDAGRTGGDGGPPTDSGMVVGDAGMDMGDGGGGGTDGGMDSDAGMTMGDAGGMTDAGGSSGASFAEVQTIITARCAGCHSTPHGGLSLNGTPAQVYAELVTETRTAATCGGRSTRVMAGAPMESVFFLRVSGTSCGSRMPNGGPALGAADVETIRSWIAGGAPMP